MNCDAHSGHVVIVGAGHGGANVAALLRQQGYDGRVTLVGEEPDLPYQRPPLSKDYLKGAMTEEHLLIKPGGFYRDQAIDLRRGERVVQLDAASRTAVLAGGEVLHYDALVLATGAAPRRLMVEGAGLPGVHYLRDHRDAQRLAEVVVPGSRLAIVGGGYVGLEVAASARHLGASAVVLEREDRALARVAGRELAAFLTTHHAEQGVDIVTGADVAGLVPGPDGAVSAVALGDGREMPCDAVLVGIGAVPRTELAESAGVLCDGGIVVDGRGRTSVAGIYAVGDVTRRPLDHFVGSHRLESIPSAVEQAKHVVAEILAHTAPSVEVPWFWSDQYDLRIKIAGLVSFGDQSVLRGDPAAGKFSVFHLSGDRVVAAETVNNAPEFMVARKLIASETPVPADKLADQAMPLKDLVA